MQCKHGGSFSTASQKQASGVGGGSWGAVGPLSVCFIIAAKSCFCLLIDNYVFRRTSRVWSAAAQRDSHPPLTTVTSYLIPHLCWESAALFANTLKTVGRRHVRRGLFSLVHLDITTWQLLLINKKKQSKKDGCVGHQKDEARLTVLYLKKKKKKKEHCIVSRLLFCLWSSDGKLPAFTSGLNLWEGLSHYTTPACVILVTLCSNTKPFWVHEILDIGRSVSAILCTSILQMFLLNLYLPSSVCTVSMFFFFFALLHSRSVSCSQRGLQSPVHCGTGERGCVFLSPWASPGLQQQDVWGGGLLQPPPKVQPGVWAVQDHGEVLLLPGMGARPRWRQLSQHR